MRTYADPTRCPDCSTRLPQHPQTCPVCALPLTGQDAVELFATLQQADRLLAHLRAGAPPSTAPREVSAPPSDGVAQLPATRPAERGSSRLSGASVPKILLTLGALCLLVAAVIFLAVAWGWLGVGGRTVVLAVLTVAALGAAVVLHRRALRMAGEALSVVGLGLLALDVVGTRHAGWLGQVGDAHLVLLTGCVVATGSLVMLLLTASRPLVAPACIAPLAVLVAGIGAQWHVRTPGPMLVALLVLLALGRVGTTLPSAPLRVASLTTGGLAWIYVVGSGLDLAARDQTVAHLWGELAIWPLVAATAVAAVVGPAVGMRHRLARAGYGVAALLGSYVVVLAALDNSATVAVSCLTAVAACWIVVLLVAPASLRPAVVVPLAGTLVLPLAAAFQLLTSSVEAVLGTGEPNSSPFDVHVAATTPWVSPLLLVPVLLVLAAAGCALLGLRSGLRRTTWALVLAGAAVVGAVATVPLYDVPLAVVVGLLTLGSAGALAGAERAPGAAADALRVVGAALGLAAVVGALPSDVLTTGVLAVLTVAAGALMTRTDLTGDVADVAFPIVFGGLVWAAGSVASVPAYDRAVPVLLVLGALAIWRPEPTLEVPVAVVAVVVSAGAVLDARDTLLALSVHLTVAGALVTTSAILHPTRRLLAWPGGLLLAMATWARLADLGVHTPEAYTLPTAVALTAVGVWRLRHDRESSTLTMLAPGLLLATVPSLLATLDDPVSWRAALLGLGCLVMVLAGVHLRWSAPLVIGACVGAALVLRELAPYAGTVPSWLLIGLSGTLLTLVGVTWESRMRDLRTASGYLAGLR